MTHIPTLQPVFSFDHPISYGNLDSFLTPSTQLHVWCFRSMTPFPVWRWPNCCFCNQRVQSSPFTSTLTVRVGEFPLSSWVISIIDWLAHHFYRLSFHELSDKEPNFEYPIRSPLISMIFISTLLILWYLWILCVLTTPFACMLIYFEPINFVWG